ncbi:hypothetical protein AVEN_96972-1 [Araneus ventricosus]|uniref:LIM zinc-binding domain-containing protein n=1 Tax=Araneus ventricosus TaxID=182803 RepID=A0A4Y2NQS9_ARAVE|nr:hypothetical protein AVEN_96972-1 [Araneus ventricosus]
MNESYNIQLSTHVKFCPSLCEGEKGTFSHEVSSHSVSHPSSERKVIAASSTGRRERQNVIVTPVYRCTINRRKRGFHQQRREMASGQSYLGTCAKCLGVINEKCCQAENLNYHQRCFVCALCCKQLYGNPYYTMNGKPYCEEDYLSKLDKCASCNRPTEK